MYGRVEVYLNHSCLDTGWRRVVNFTPRPVYLRGKVAQLITTILKHPIGRIPTNCLNDLCCTPLGKKSGRLLTYLGAGRARAQAVSRPGSSPGQVMLDFCLTKWNCGQVFSEYFGFPCQFSFHRLLHTYHDLSSEAGAICQLVAEVPSELSLTPHKKLKKFHIWGNRNKNILEK
jgi:hypothetical protein